MFVDIFWQEFCWQASKIRNYYRHVLMCFPGGSNGKESACNAGDRSNAGLIPELGRSPGEGNDKPV